jgi:anti-sigma factor RsiW
MCEYPEFDFHLREETLNEYLDGELPSNDTVALESHLDTCIRCKTRLEALLYVFQELEDLPDIPLERDFAPEIVHTICQQRRFPLQSRSLKLAFAFQILATIMLLRFSLACNYPLLGCLPKQR